jgi:MFS family permease
MVTHGKTSSAYAWWVVVVLTLVATVSYIDRQMLSLLIGALKADLGVTDTQAGLLTGFAFVTLFALLGVPIGRIADTKNRVKLIAVGMAVWSVMTALCGLARNFPVLFAARVGVGVGEAALTPAAYSLFADYFPPQKLSRVIAVFTLAIYFGMGAALALGGTLVSFLEGLAPVSLPVLGPMHTWQLAMFSVGLPSLLLLPLLFTIREPARKETHGEAADGAPAPKLLAYFAAHWRTYLPLFVGFSMISLSAVALATWSPELFRRAYGWPMKQTGAFLGLTMILVGGPSTVIGGLVGDRLRAKGRLDGAFLLAMLVLALAVPAFLVLGFVPDAGKAQLALAVALGLLTFPGALGPAAVQLVTANRVRAQVSAVYVCCTNLVGAGLGPLAVGMVSDALGDQPRALAWAVGLVGAIACPLGVLILWSGRKAYVQMMERGQ